MARKRVTRGASSSRPLWACPSCGEQFTTARSWHSCGKFDLAAHFAGAAPVVRRLFDRFVEMARAHGPLTVIPQKSRIALQARMRFAALMPQQTALRGHLVLAERCDSPRFAKIETYSPRNHVHVFRLTDVAQLDAEFAAFIALACAVGRQEHLARCTSDDVRALALALPGAVESAHMGQPDFRVRDRIFASLPHDGATVSLKISGPDLEALVAADPVTYRAVWGGRWLSVALATVPRKALAALIADAHAALRKPRPS